VTVELTFEFKVERGFFWTGRFPASLMEEIGLRKNDLYKKLAPDITRADMLVGSELVAAEGRRFEVTFAADRYQTSSDIRPMRVIYIEEK
jgi:hypothetical protein